MIQQNHSAKLTRRWRVYPTLNAPLIYSFEVRNTKNQASKNKKTCFGECCTCYGCVTQKGVVGISVIFHDWPNFSHIQKVSARAFHWCVWTYVYVLCWKITRVNYPSFSFIPKTGIAFSNRVLFLLWFLAKEIRTNTSISFVTVALFFAAPSVCGAPPVVVLAVRRTRNLSLSNDSHFVKVALVVLECCERCAARCDMFK